MITYHTRLFRHSKSVIINHYEHVHYFFYELFLGTYFRYISYDWLKMASEEHYDFIWKGMYTFITLGRDTY